MSAEYQEGRAFGLRIADHVREDPSFLQEFRDAYNEGAPLASASTMDDLHTAADYARYLWRLRLQQADGGDAFLRGTISVFKNDIAENSDVIGPDIGAPDPADDMSSSSSSSSLSSSSRHSSIPQIPRGFSYNVIDKFTTDPLHLTMKERAVLDRIRAMDPRDIRQAAIDKGVLISSLHASFKLSAHVPEEFYTMVTNYIALVRTYPLSYLETTWPRDYLLMANFASERKVINALAYSIGSTALDLVEYYPSYYGETERKPFAYAFAKAIVHSFSIKELRFSCGMIDEHTFDMLRYICAMSPKLQTIIMDATPKMSMSDKGHDTLVEFQRRMSVNLNSCLRLSVRLSSLHIKFHVESGLKGRFYDFFNPVVLIDTPPIDYFRPTPKFTSVFLDVYGGRSFHFYRFFLREVQHWTIDSFHIISHTKRNLKYLMDANFIDTLGSRLKHLTVPLHDINAEAYNWFRKSSLITARFLWLNSLQIIGVSNDILPPSPLQRLIRRTPPTLTLFELTSNMHTADIAEIIRPKEFSNDNHVQFFSFERTTVLGELLPDLTAQARRQLENQSTVSVSLMDLLFSAMEEATVTAPQRRLNIGAERRQQTTTPTLSRRLFEAKAHGWRT